MVTRYGIWIAVAIVAGLMALAGCGGDDDDDDDKQAEPVAGSFVGKVPRADAFVSVVASPPAEGEEDRNVTVFVCDAEQLCELFSGSASGNDFTAEAAGGEGEAKGELTDKAATGTIEIPDEEAIRYEATQATATSGLYDLTVTREGRLRGASAAGVALRGTSTLPDPGPGSLKLADGRRLKFEATRNSDNPVRIQAGRARLIVLPRGELRGAAKTKDGDGSDFYLRSEK